jgi:hypothetical protein
MACFAIVVSDTLILNIKADELHHNRSGLNLITTMKEAAKRISDRKLECRLLIVVKDFLEE